MKQSITPTEPPARMQATELEPTQRFARPAIAGKSRGLSESYIRKLCAAGIIKSHSMKTPGARQSRCRLVDLHSLDAWIESQPSEQVMATA